MLHRVIHPFNDKSWNRHILRSKDTKAIASTKLLQSLCRQDENHGSYSTHANTDMAIEANVDDCKMGCNNIAFARALQE